MKLLVISKTLCTTRNIINMVINTMVANCVTSRSEIKGTASDCARVARKAVRVLVYQVAAPFKARNHLKASKVTIIIRV